MQIPSSAVQESLTRLTDSLDQVLDETVQLCRIPAPTFEEAERAAYVAERMRALGLTDVQIDSIHNVTGILSAGSPGPPRSWQRISIRSFHVPRLCRYATPNSACTVRVSVTTASP